VSADSADIGSIRAIAESGHDVPILMLNLNRYTSAAAYPNGEEYQTYVAVMIATIDRVGGRVLWRTPVHGQPIGCEHDRVDEILAVWYPSHAAFLDLHALEGAEDLWRRRARCVANAVIHRCPGDGYSLQP
jgi:hypothetical protein|tara:strand:- start:1117 stop:1509 length:393 start_codon:yes stop_codon:yes gene_type:complete